MFTICEFIKQVESWRAMRREKNLKSRTTLNYSSLTNKGEKNPLKLPLVTKNSLSRRTSSQPVLKIFFLSIIIILISEVVSATTIYYNFTDTDNSLAYGDSADAGTIASADGSGDFTVSGPTFAELAARVQDNFTAGGYAALATSDDFRANFTSPGANNEPYGVFNLTITPEVTSLINWMYVTMEQSEIGTTDSDCYYHIANYTGSIFYPFATVMSGASDVTKSKNITTQAELNDVIQNRIVRLMSTAQADSTEGCAVDFVGIIVNYNVSLPIFYSNATNDSSVYTGESINHSIKINASNENVSGYIFSWNASGASCDTWANSSFTSTTGRSTTASNISTIPSACEGKNIGWKFYANTSAGAVRITNPGNYCVYI